MHLKSLAKEEQTNSKATDMKEIFKIRVELNEIENFLKIQRTNEIQLFVKLKIDKLLAKLTKREKTQINKNQR